MIQDKIHNQLCKNLDAANDWFAKQRNDFHPPFYSSYDIRDSGSKVVPVDANLFPAGFNNICDVDLENAPGLIETYLKANAPEAFKKPVALLAEEHTKNAYYWENINSILSVIREAGIDCEVCMPKALLDPIEVQSINGHKLKVYGADKQGGKVFVNNKEISLIVNNNDFSNGYEEWVGGLETKINPHFKLGWYQRKKVNFFKYYNQLASDFCKVIDVSPSHLKIRTEEFENFDIGNEENRENLALKVDNFISELKKSYDEDGFESDPYVFIKNNAGTYGLGVTKVSSGDDVRNWNNKARKKMKATKGGGGISSVIIQEGVPTRFTEDNVSAEPAIYLLGCQLAGGFLRTHDSKDASESLNAPGAVYQKLCVSDLKVNIDCCPMENVYGWIAKLGLLAVSKEAQEIL